MRPGPVLTTERLLLRRWSDGDREPFARMNVDPLVMEHFPRPLTRQDSDALVDRIETSFEENGFGLWAVEVQQSGEFIGFTGLVLQTFEAHFTPAVEVGWRLAAAAWGHGYATEAAVATLDHAFGPLALEQVVSMTATTNLRSTRLMERLGMTRDRADDFEHPRVAEVSPLRRHVLYRVDDRTWHLSRRR